MTPPAISLEAKALALGYPRSPPLAHDMGFALSPGEALVLLGPNGCGKTTLLRCVLGLTRPLTGQVHAQGQDVHAMTAAQRAHRMAYVPQATVASFPFEVLDVVLMGRSVHLRFMADPGPGDRAAAHVALERVGIGHLAARRFDALSGGERQLALLARALAQAAPIIVLDEPCASLDPGHQVQVLGALRALMGDGHSILMSSHLPEHALWLDAQVLLMARGRHEGPAPARQALTSTSLGSLYGTPIEAVTLDHGPASGRCVFVPLDGRHTVVHRTKENA